MRNSVKLTLLLAAATVLLAGCESAPAIVQEGKDEAASPDNELFIYTVWPAFYVKEDIFEKQIGQFIKKKFPDIRIKHVHWDNPGKQYQDLIAAGTVPDIIMDDSHLNLNRYILDNDLQYDMRELIKKYNFDTSKLNGPSMDRMRNISQDGAVYGLPFLIGDFLLFYNKDIFDKFGVDYPHNGMTYDEAYEKAKKLTRVEGEITYKGYSQNPGHYMNYNQLSLHPLSATEDKASLVSDGWKKLVDNLRRFYDIPANQFDTVEKFSQGNIAMAVASADRIVKFYEDNKQLNFDISTVPVFADLPETRYQPNLMSAYITKQSQKKDLAFQVISFLLSEEMQIELAKEGNVVPVQTPAVQAAFGKNLPQMQGKHIDSIFYGKYAGATPARAPGLTYHLVATQNVFDPLISKESKDTVTALRMTEEKETKAILTEKAAKEELNKAAQK
ncbi:putative arabinose-binding protein precursor [Paenibacillus konkukensis]|uniref:Arabinose-binding protein n=1 Tax=Paenibacillus konkukensis TaxID=2020716 RepID=A0ABY4RHZ9_9BACL|nr:extracellular solute-binding protein [Paenibacillus konkukensis]UQZ81797.1 putative arabinose-binding protein precursor [Paenibacillus konkukensis]